MNILLWTLQGLAALVYGASGVMKLFMFDKVSADVPSFGALPKGAWMALGVIELACKPSLTVAAATVLALESLVFIWVHVRYHEVPPILMSTALGLLMAFIAYGRAVLKPLG